jgi:hypothetical protein
MKGQRGGLDVKRRIARHLSLCEDATYVK